MNTIFTIRPYLLFDRWVFDDPVRGFLAEPFVAGADRMIDLLTQAQGIRNAAAGFHLTFGLQPFPGAQGCLKRSGPGQGGMWYRTNVGGVRVHGWFCPGLLRYFAEPPATIWAAAEADR